VKVEGANPGLSPDSLVTVRVQCLDGDMASTVEATIRAGDCLLHRQQLFVQLHFGLVQGMKYN
jgi:hypothetical protein